MHKGLFTTNGFEHPHIGYTAGIRWNGWATPFFEIDEAFKIMEEFNKEQPEHPIMYAEASDTFMQKIADDEIELWKGKNYETDEGIKHLYGIGAYSWTWEDTTEQDIYNVASRIEDFLWELDIYEHRNQYADSNELFDAIVIQLQDLKVLKQVLIALYTEELAEQELFNKLSEVLKV